MDLLYIGKDQWEWGRTHPVRVPQQADGNVFCRHVASCAVLENGPRLGEGRTAFYPLFPHGFCNAAPVLQFASDKSRETECLLKAEQYPAISGFRAKSQDY